MPAPCGILKQSGATPNPVSHGARQRRQLPVSRPAQDRGHAPIHLIDSRPARGRQACLCTTRRSLRVPRTWGLRPSDVVLAVAGNAVLIVVLWVRHGQFPHLTDPAAVLIAVGQVGALLGTYLALVQVVLMSRSPWLDSLFGIDRIAGWHRWLGFGTLDLIIVHVVFTTAGYAIADGRSLRATWTFLTTYPYMLMAYVGGQKCTPFGRLCQWVDIATSQWLIAIRSTS